MITMKEPLEKLARFSFDWAPTLCGPNCAAYHQAWSTIRLLMRNSDLPSGLHFFAKEMNTFAGPDKPRVLISGGADTGLFALAVEAFGAKAAEAEFVFADACATSVEQNRLYARHCGLKADFHLGDICDLQTAPADVILAHNFLYFFEPSRRHLVTQTWARSLKPQGRVLIYQGLQQPVSRRSLPQTPDPTLGPQIRQAALKFGMGDDLATMVEQTANRFWEKQTGYTAVTRSELEAYLESSGLRISAITVDEQTNNSPYWAGNRQNAPARTCVVAMHKSLT